MPRFDVEPTTSYSGSYTDIVVTGSKTSTGNATQMFVSSSVRKSQVGNAALDDPKLYNGVRDFGAYHRLLASNYALGVNQRFVSHVSSEKIIYDSHVPDMASIFAADGAHPMFTSYQNPSRADIRVQFIFGMRDTDGVFYRRTSSYASDTYASLTNDSWIFSFPFEYKYRDAPRRAGTFVDANGLIIRASSSFCSVGSSPVFNVAGLDPVGVAPSEKRLDSLDPFAGGFTGNILGTTASFQVGFMGKKAPGVAAPADFTFYPIEEYTHTSYPPSVPASILNPMSFAANNIDSIRFAYGFGDGPSGIATPATPITASHVTEGTAVRVWFGGIIRGWKYGLYNGIPTPTKCVFLRNHFGSHRDMLEQRIFTREINKTTGTIEGPVELSFISGSDAYVTASNPALNVRQAGFYDFQYRAGAPFKDV